jgi:hypothetical protein
MAASRSFLERVSCPQSDQEDAIPFNTICMLVLDESNSEDDAIITVKSETFMGTIETFFDDVLPMEDASITIVMENECEATLSFECSCGEVV